MHNKARFDDPDNQGSAGVSADVEPFGFGQWAWRREGSMVEGPSE